MVEDTAIDSPGRRANSFDTEHIRLIFDGKVCQTADVRRIPRARK